MSSVLQRFAAFLAPLTSGRVTIAVSSVYISKVMIPSLYVDMNVLVYFFIYILQTHQTLTSYIIMPFIFCC